MRPATPVLSPADHLGHAAELMMTFEVRELAVVDQGRLVGILTRSDLEPHVGHLEWTPVRLAMTPQPTTVAPDASVVTVAKTLVEGKFNGVPVVADEELAGMISRRDVLQLLADWPVDGKR